MTPKDAHAIVLEGRVHPDFRPVARQLRRLIPRHGSGGAAVCVYHRGACVADLWGGTRDARGAPWTHDTLALCYSTGKGVLATLAHVLVERGALAYDVPVAHYWPGFARRGKAAITVRQLLCHAAGLHRVGDMVDDAARMLDWRHMVGALEEAAPAWPPGSAHGYHGFTFGWLVGELVQRATGRALSALLDECLVRPLGLDGCYFGLPDAALGRRAELVGGRLPVDRATRAAGGAPMDVSELEAALLPPGVEALDWNAPALLGAVLPAVNGVFTARSLARLYAALACGGRVDGARLLSRETLAEATRVHGCGTDRVVPLPMDWRLGYHGIPTVRVCAPRAFGHFGIGGSGALADPDRELAVALVVNSGLGTPFGDTRIVRVASAALRAADARAGRASPCGAATSRPARERGSID